MKPISPMPNKSIEFRPSGSIEFERVEVNVVDKPVPVPVDEALDIDPLSINFGRRKDHKPASTERMLAGPTIDWLVAFPVDSRPKALCERFPHVANRLAMNWSHSARSAQSLQTLVADARWGGAGFPVQVQSELLRMLEQLANLQTSK